VFFGKLDKQRTANLPDLKGHELAVFIPAVLAIVAGGLFPRQLLQSWSRRCRSSSTTSTSPSRARWPPHIYGQPPPSSTAPPVTPPTEGYDRECEGRRPVSFNPADSAGSRPYLILVSPACCWSSPSVLQGQRSHALAASPSPARSRRPSPRSSSIASSAPPRRTHLRRWQGRSDARG